MLIAIAVSGISTPQPDEGTGAHLFQIWLVLEMLMITFFALKWFPRNPKQVAVIVALQIAAALLPMAVVFSFNESSVAHLKPNTSVTKNTNQSSLKNLPSDIFPEQIGSFSNSFSYPSTYFVDGKLYALVLEPNLNYDLPALENKTISWHGILQSEDNGQTWNKFFNISDPVDPTQKGQTIKYNPVGVFADGQKLYIDIVNDRGAGSGEGQLIRFLTADNGKIWQRDACYYFIPEKYYSNAHEDKISQISPHQLEITKSCVY